MNFFSCDRRDLADVDRRRDAERHGDEQRDDRDEQRADKQAG